MISSVRTLLRGIISTLKIIISLMVIFYSLASIADTETFDESKLEAAFIYNFLKYTTWPTVKPDGQPIRIVVLDKNELFESLQALTQDKTINGHTIEVYNNQRNLLDIDVFFSSSLNRSKSDDLKERSILTISSAENSRAMIKFFQEDQKIRFEVSLSAVENAKLKLSSQLLKVARVVP